MAEAKIDNNFKKTALAYDGTSEVEPLRVDAVTNRLLIEVEFNGDTTPATLTGKKDNNFIPVSYAVTDDINKTVTPLIVHPTANYLYVDFIYE